MKNKNWIPKENELIIFKGKLFNVISINLAGKCNIKGFTTTARITKKIKNVDINEIHPFKPS